MQKFVKKNMHIYFEFRAIHVIKVITNYNYYNIHKIDTEYFNYQVNNLFKYLTKTYTINSK